MKLDRVSEYKTNFNKIEVPGFEMNSISSRFGMSISIIACNLGTIAFEKLNSCVSIQDKYLRKIS